MDSSISPGLRKTPNPFPGVSMMSSFCIAERTRLHHAGGSSDVPDSGRLRGSASVVGVACVVERVEGDVRELVVVAFGVVASVPELLA
eukprot:5288689-Prymnesium_polylepis.1